MLPAACGNLRTMCHSQQLSIACKPVQPFTNGACHGPANAAINLVKDDGGCPALLCQRHLQRKDEARQFAATSDLAKRCKRRAGIGGDKKLNRVHPACAPALLRQFLDLSLKLRCIKFQWGEFLGHSLVQFLGCFHTRFVQSFGL